MKESFAEWLTKQLKEKKIKKKDFATTMNTTPQTVSRWCNGVVIPEDATIRLIEYEFGIYPNRQKIIEGFTTKELLAEIERRCGE